MITSAQRCLECGSELPSQPPEGLCPACLLKTALAGEPEAGVTEDLWEDGQRFGPYTTLRTLGEGGMGIVYLARQEQPIHRTVALKVIKPGMDSRQVIVRFESERQALALMDHPNIARVFDAGAAEDGRPYFAMEYVPGVPLLEYCDANRLTNPQRLELFREICLAIHHAHQKGIIHRDLKPSNVLVEVQDGKPVPKVIDFGVAKATRQRLTEHTVFTEAGVLMGTPEYMSPEQVAMADYDVDASTDIYSLGVLLYELITGVLPFDSRALRRGGYFQMQRTICDQEPPSPAARLRALGPAAEEIAKRRQTDAHSLERQVRGDLEWITMRALEKDRSRRYASASELAADIARHLNDEPVLAGPPTRAYRLRKFVRRHRLGVTAAAAIVVCLLAGAATSTALYFRARQQRDIAERQSYEANLANADALIESGDVEAARERLFQCPQRLRNWPWRLLYALSDTSTATLRGTGDPVPDDETGGITFAFSPDGKRMYFRMRRTVHAWEIPSWKPVADYGVFGPILGMSQDGSSIVTRSLRKGDPELFILDPVTGRRIARLTGHPATLTAGFNLAGNLVATGPDDSEIRLWNAQSGRLLGSARTPGEFAAWARVVFSPNGRYIAFASGSGLLHLLDARRCKLLRSLPCQRRIFTAAFSPDSRRVAAADGLATIRIWNVAAGRQEIAWTEVNTVNTAAFSPDGTRLVTGTQTGVVRVWDAASGSPIATLTGPTAELRAVTFSPDGKWILAGSNAGEVWVWDAQTYGGQLLSRSAMYMVISRNGKRFAVTDLKEVTVLDAASGRVIRKGLPLGWPLALSPGGDRLAIGDSAGRVRVIELPGGSVALSLAGHRSQVSSLVFSPDGRYLASGSWDKTAHIWDAASGHEHVLLRLGAEVNNMAFSPDGKLLATGTAAAFGDGLCLWEVPSGKLIRRFLPASGILELVTAVAFDPRGDRLASDDYYSRRIRIDDLRAGRRIADMAGHADAPINSLAFSPDGCLLASGAYDNTVRLWDTSRNELTFTLRRPPEPALRVEFSRAGDRLYASYYHGALRVWSTSTAYPPEIRERVARFQREDPVMADVWRRIEDDTTLDKAQRRAAQILYAWRVDYDRTLRSGLWRPAVYPPDSISERKLLLRRAEDTYAALPWSVEAWTILGGAQYRNRLYAEAARTLARASETAYEDPRADAFLAMTLYRLDQTGQAREALNRSRLLLKDADPVPRHDGEALIAEAEALLAQR